MKEGRSLTVKIPKLNGVLVQGVVIVSHKLIANRGNVQLPVTLPGS